MKSNINFSFYFCGFNIAILAGLVSLLFGSACRSRWESLLAIPAIGAYTMMVGAEASVVRAALMGSLSLLVAQLGRRQIGLNTLGLAGRCRFSALVYGYPEAGGFCRSAAAPGWTVRCRGFPRPPAPTRPGPVCRAGFIHPGSPAGYLAGAGLSFSHSLAGLAAR